MTMLAEAQLNDLAAVPRELAIIVDTEPGSAEWHVGFAVQEQPAVRRPQVMTSLRVHVPLEVIPASPHDLQRLVEASAADALPVSVLTAVTAQVTAISRPAARRRGCSPASRAGPLSWRALSKN